MASPLRNQPLDLPGDGDAVLLAHGLSGGVYEVQWLAEHLHQALGLRVVADWLPGHVPGPGPMPPCRGEAWLAALEDAWRRLQAVHPRVHLVGFSTGCLAVLRLAEVHAMSGRLVLLAPFMGVHRPRWLPWTPERLLAALPGLRQVPSRAPPLQDGEVRRAVEAVRPFRSFNLEAARTMAAFRDDTVVPALGAVRAPVLIVQGRRDSVVDADGARRLAAVLGAQAGLLELAHSDHLVGLDRERELVFEAVTGHLRGSFTS